MIDLMVWELTLITKEESMKDSLIKERKMEKEN